MLTISPSLVHTFYLLRTYASEPLGQLSRACPGGLPKTLLFIVITIRRPKRDLPFDPFSLFQVALSRMGGQAGRQGSLDLEP